MPSMFLKKGKGFPYSTPSVGPGADPGVQAAITFRQACSYLPSRRGCADVTYHSIVPWVQSADVKYHSVGGVSAVIVMYRVIGQ